MATAEHTKRYREKIAAQRQAQGLSRHPKKKNRKYPRVTKPFIGCDGEGGGTDELGRQKFLLFRIGGRELETGKNLTTEQCLEFICQAPDTGILVGFYFGYDSTMILRDLPKPQLDFLFNPWRTEAGEASNTMLWTYYKGYGIKYLPRQYISVCRLDRFNRIVKGSIRTIYETAGFFQGKFVKVLKDYGVATEEELSFIAQFKGERDNFDKITPEIREYNRMECVLLSRLMDSFRDCCRNAILWADPATGKTKDLSPKTWNGAGKLATRMHTVYKTPTREFIRDTVPNDVMRLAAATYYGGRFEITRIGKIPGPIHEYDISSAYPDAMQGLPCLLHGLWEPFGTEGPHNPDGLWLASVAFTHDRERNVYGVPIRDESGTIYWPRTGNGSYWSTELQAAERLGCRWTYRHGYEYIRRCDCQTFSWVNDLFIYRRSIGKSAKGYPIKLGLNSLYGKFAQRVGKPKFGNFLYASLITARTRAKINEAISCAPDDIIMIATDGIYSTSPLDIPVNDHLGGWEHTVFSEIFVVKPGLYWAEEKLKTRGIDKRDVQQNIERFETEWQNFATSARRKEGSYAAPIIPVRTKLFTGLKLAYARGKPETAGTWTGEGTDKPRNISFAWHQKRKAKPKWKGSIAMLEPYPGSQSLFSCLYSDTEEASLEADMMREEFADMPDSVDAIGFVLGD